MASISQDFKPSNSSLSIVSETTILQIPILSFVAYYQWIV